MLLQRLYRSRTTENSINLLFIFLFVYTASSKLIQHQLFRTTLFQSPLLGSYASLLSWTIPVIELIVAAALLCTAYRRSGAWATLLLMLVFTSYIAFMIIYSPDLPCSCGGIISELTWLQHLALNITLTCLALIQVLLQNKTSKPSPGYSHAFRVTKILLRNNQEYA